jgi:S-adenosylmethionine:tRNA ribosyltransferase-isomerase
MTDARQYGADPLGAYDYELPSELIAERPPRDRDGGRLLTLLGESTEHRTIRDLPMLLAPGDLLVLNDTRVLPARIEARRATGGKVEVLFLGTDAGEVTALVRPARKMRVGEVLAGPGGSSIEIVADRGEGIFAVRSSPEPDALMAAHGRVPLPPYIGRGDDPEDRERYQTVFARRPGAVAAPTAGLHLTDPLLDALRARGVSIATITLHVGLGTFLPLRPSDLARGTLHEERMAIPDATAQAVRATRERGGRIVACGTTVTRALETRATPEGGVAAGESSTTLFLREGSEFRVVDLLLTNFHLPQSSLLMLVAAFAGRERVLRAYEDAVRARYRFYSYGDAMLVSKKSAPP